MIRRCPSCKSYNARRSTVRTSEVTLRHVFLSPYRCRDCRSRFWVLSRNSYYFAGVAALSVTVGVLTWYWPDELDFSPSERVSAVAPDTRIADLSKRADSSDPNAEYELARMYAAGDDVPRNAQSEAEWLKRAAEHGNVQAQYEYGIALRDGRGTVQDHVSARKWIQLAAEAGIGSAQLALGNMYRMGTGIPVDNLKAYVWLNVAAAQDVRGAATARDSLLPRLTPTELQDAQAEANRLSAAPAQKATPSK
jgi:hypothetical protein